MHTFTRVSDGGGKQLGTIKQTDELDLSKGVESPSWKISTKSFTGSPGLRFEADFGLQKDPRLVFEGYDRWSFVGREIQEGMSVEVWEGVSGDDPKKRITAHIDADSAWLLKAEFTFPFRFPLGSMLVKAALVCSPTSEGIWLPTRMTVDQGGRILLMTRQIVMEKTYTEWSRPAATNLPTETVGSQKNQTTNKR